MILVFIGFFRVFTVFKVVDSDSLHPNLPRALNRALADWDFLCIAQCAKVDALTSIYLDKMCAIEHAREISILS